MSHLALATILAVIGWLGFAAVLLVARLEDQPRFEDRRTSGRHRRRSLLHPDGVPRRDAITVTELTAVRDAYGADPQYSGELHQMVVDLDAATVRLAPVGEVD